MEFKLRIKNANQVVCISSTRQLYKIRDDMKCINVINDATVVVGIDGRIYAVDTESNLQNEDWYRQAIFLTDIDAKGQSVLPGFVDSHTHPVWAGDRVHEFAMKLEGATYMEIHKAGGGIGFTVRHTRESSKETLSQLLDSRLKRFIKQGTTLLEAKSGYGLDLATEIKLLTVLHEACQRQPLKIISTYLGAHSVPPHLTAIQAAQEIVDHHLPEIIDLKGKNVINPRFIDVFYEKGIFERAETISILEAGKKSGLEISFHGDELNSMGSGELGAQLNARAISHLEEITDDGIKAMATNGIFGILLPTTAYMLKINPPPARRMIEAGVPIALGSDFNPNVHCLSMPLVMNLACVTMKMTMPEALVACTLNAAAALYESDDHGSIEVGKLANFVIVNHPHWEHIIYEMGDSPISKVIIQGDIVHTN